MPDLLDRLQQFVDAERRVAATGIVIPDSSIVLTDPPITKQPTPGTYVVKGASHEYSSMTSWNPGLDAMVLQIPGGEVWLLTGTGGADPDGKVPVKLPWPIKADSQTRWAKRHPHLLYFRYQDRLQSLDVADFNSMRTVHKFTGYGDINIGIGEGDISADGDHFVMASGPRVFVYEISTDRILWEWIAPWPFNNLYISADNNVLVSTESGVYIVVNGVMRPKPVAARMGHMDVTRDTNGDACLIWTNSNDPEPIDNCKNGIVKVRLADGEQTCLLEMDWSFAVHISCPDNAGFALVSAFQPVAAGHARIIKVPLDGSRGEILEEWDGAFNDYMLQPKASVSHDGSRFVWAVNGNAHIRVL